MTQATTPAVVVEATTKASIARPIFNSFLKDGKLIAERKVVIAAIAEGAKLSAKGAATYYQNFKDKAGLVQKKAAAVAA